MPNYDITKEDLDHFLKKDWDWFDSYGQYERNEVIDKIYDGLLNAINNKFSMVINNAS